ncbi:unnamed protein product, partial [Mesorhabditis belari]|uniref:Uncharacterized protein n=1 Tax=Mesorhabditis belari TaxID=2138241 RepID=A0AAF3EFE3_9BILA
MFSREGSLIRKKQRQWAQEKEEKEREKDWFPFGANNSPGGGNPVRKHEARDYSDNKMQSTGRVRELSPTPVPLRCPAAGISTLEAISCNMKEKETHAPTAATASMSQPYPMQMPPYVYPMTPEYWQAYSTNPHQLHLAYPPIPMPYHMIPPGAIPIPPPTMMCNTQEGTMPATPITPFYTPEQWNDINKPKLPATAIVYPLPTPIVMPEDHKVPSCQISPIQPVFVDFRHGTASSSESSRPDAYITAQVEEKRRQQRELEEKARVDEEKIRQIREHQEQQQFLEEQKKLEAEKDEELKRERIYQQVLNSIERAKRDAELTKKAKIYKHVMEGQPDQEKALLGEDGSRILKEVNAMERHRQLELEQIAHARSPSKDAENKNRHHVTVHPDNRPIRSMSDQATSPFERGTGSRTSLRQSPTQKRPSLVKRSNSAERNDTFVIASGLVKKSPNGGELSTRESRIPRADKSLMRTSKTAIDDEPRMKEIEMKIVDHSEPEPLSATISTSSAEGTSSPVEVMLISEPGYSEEPIEVQLPAERFANRRSIDGPWTSTPRTTAVTKHTSSIRQLPEEPARRVLQRPAALDPRRKCPNDALRGSVDSNDASSSGSASPSRAQSQRSPSIPSVNVQDSDAENRFASNNQHDKLYSISQSPVASLGRTRSGTNNTPLFHKRLGELGAAKNQESQDSMAPETRRLAEQRFPSMERLRSSMLNLASTDDATKNRPASPLLDQFKSRAPQYRSFTLKKNSEKQAAILERLNAMRERLHEKDSLKDRTTNLLRVATPNSARGQRT